MIRESRIMATQGKLTVAGDYIKEKRIKQKMTCEELARKMQEHGMPMKRELIFRIEHGQRLVSLEEISIICVILDIDGTDLIKYVVDQIDKNCNMAAIGKIEK